MKREWLGPVVVVVLGVAFAAVRALVWLSRGNPRLVQRKLRLGGLLLGWTGAVTGAGCENASCYETTGNYTPTPTVELTGDDGTGTVTLAAGSQLTLADTVAGTYSLQLYDVSSNKQTDGSLLPMGFELIITSGT